MPRTLKFSGRKSRSTPPTNGNAVNKTRPPTSEGIQDAANTIEAQFLNSPQFEHDVLNDHLGFRLVCKVETLNPLRSFKGRGTDWFVHQLCESGPPETQLVCASAGNFGQGLAYACRKRGLELTIVTARGANAYKCERMRQLGAEVRLAGHDFDAAKAEARRYAEGNGLLYVEDGREPEIAEGAGTIGLELTTYPESFDAVLIPVGNGALINGIGTWFKSASPTTKIVGVVAASAPAMARSWQQNSVVTTESADTIADGIAVRIPVPEALETMRHTVDDIILVSDEHIVQAMRLAHRTLGLVLEPAGAAGLAAALSAAERFEGQRIATPLCGSNLTAEQLEQWL